MKLKYQLPDLYQNLLPRVILNADLTETKATCQDCAMAPLKRGVRARITYEPHLKCCTYEPFLPNYLVGSVLLQAQRFPQGVAALRRKISTREYALPLGTAPRVSFQVEFNARKEGEFGNREDWLCPYYQTQTQNCGIWKYRGAVCTSFFCKSDYGSKGLGFWEKLSNYLSYVEMALAEECLVELDFSPRQISEQLQYLNRQEASVQELLSPSLAPKNWKSLWNGYDSDIEVFYKKCAQKVQAWDRARLKEAIGEAGAEIETQLKKSLSRLDEGGRV